VAGMSRMVSQWADWGLKVSQTAQRIGMGARQLSNLQSAANLAGSSADAMSGGLQTLGQAMYDAVGGRNADAVVMFRTLGIAFQDATGHARQAADVMPQIADKIQSIKDPFAQAQVATTLFGGAAEGLLPILRLGSAGIRELQATAQRYGYVTEDSIKAAGRLALSQRKVEAAVEGLRNRIAERLEPILTPMLTHFADWLSKSPQVAAGVEWLGQKVGELGDYLQHVDWAAVGQQVSDWGQKIAAVTDYLGGPTRAIEALMALMVGSFTLKVITPFITLAEKIGAATLGTRALRARGKTSESGD
jgi:hypothetical protein